MNTTVFMLLTISTLCMACNKGDESDLDNTNILYTMPDEGEAHYATWIQWPHHYQYGMNYRNSLDQTWVAMTKALVTSEIVNIIAYDETEKRRIIKLLDNAGIPLEGIRFFIFKTDDVWVRDNGPIYARDTAGNLVIQDWGFNGWGRKNDDQTGLPIQYSNCDAIPSKIAEAQEKLIIDLSKIMINEGGSIEIDGHGTLMACKSSILNPNRNSGLTQVEAEQIFKKYLGVSNFVWLDGVPGLELTDQHIDGFARFGNSTTIVTMERNDLLEFDVKSSDIDKLYRAKNIHGQPYELVKLPLTRNTVKTAKGYDLGYKGSYVNYYIANTVVLVPNYADIHDNLANDIIQRLYPSRKVVGIDVRDLYSYGGMIHCVTQQQPMN